MPGFKNQRRRGIRSLRNRRFYRGNYYFKQHREQAGYSKLVSNKTTLKKIINADLPIYVLTGQYSFTKTGVPSTIAHTDYFTTDEFKECANIYQQFRVIGVRYNIYRVGQPALITRENVNHEWGLLGIRTSITQQNQLEDQIKASDTTFWVSYLGEWMTYSKFVSFNTKIGENRMTLWSSTSIESKQVYMSIATKGNVLVPDGYKIFLLSMQYMIEFSNPN